MNQFQGLRRKITFLSATEAEKRFDLRTSGEKSSEYIV